MIFLNLIFLQGLKRACVDKYLNNRMEVLKKYKNTNQSFDFKAQYDQFYLNDLNKNNYFYKSLIISN